MTDQDLGTRYRWQVWAEQDGTTGRWAARWSTADRAPSGAPLVSGYTQPRHDTAAAARGEAYQWIARREADMAAPTEPVQRDTEPSVPTAADLADAMAAWQAQFGEPDVRLGPVGG